LKCGAGEGWRLVVPILSEMKKYYLESRSILHEISTRKAKWIGHSLRRNCLLQRVMGDRSDRRTRKKT